ncbi:hypothetical protein ACJRO7_014161 [Eucalyptus globulus]|uniref:Uncharacterized protein n=1 Tax=Eucalyptus globulus TaxID=34317 RepID=A0ABD3L0B5_EUCGL
MHKETSYKRSVVNGRKETAHVDCLLLLGDMETALSTEETRVLTGKEGLLLAGERAWKSIRIETDYFAAIMDINAASGNVTWKTKRRLDETWFRGILSICSGHVDETELEQHMSGVS